MCEPGLPSNKTVSGNNAGGEKAPHHIITPNHLYLRLDKLSITYSIKDKETQYEVWQELMVTAKSGHPYANVYIPRSRYKINCKVQLTDDPHKTVLIQTQPKKKDDAFFRIELNPDKVGPEGIERLKIELETLLPYGYDGLLEIGNATRVDIALDILGVNINDLHLVPQQPLRTNLYADTKGKIETLYLGTNKSPRFWRIYNKAHLIRKNGGKFDGECTRIERTHRTKMPVKELAKFPNPYTALTVSAFPVKPKSILEHEWRFFEIVAKTIGINAALAMLPKARRKIYRKALAECSVDWWLPDQFWNMWEDHLTDLGILTGFHSGIGVSNVSCN